MKKLFALVSAMIMSLCLTSCGMGSAGNAQIGETYTVSGVEFTVNYMEFTDVIYTHSNGGGNYAFWQAPPADTSDYYFSSYAKSPTDSDDTIFILSYTAKNVSKSDKKIDETGVLNYDDGYMYSDGHLSYRLSGSDDTWQEIYSGLNLEQLKEDSYEFRAYTIVPKELAESDKSLTCELFGVTYTIR